jgi:diketogulonate reductase-like aldo/keto reductase
MMMQQTIPLANGVHIPLLGLGVYQSDPGTETQQAILWALEAGYRHIDTARLYGNERDIAAILPRAPVPRQELFITTKLWDSDHGYASTIAAFENSRRDLGVEQVDLYLVHHPIAHRLRKETWRAMEQLLQDGRCRAIGVSNHNVEDLEQLLEVALHPPLVNQVEFHPFLYQKALLSFCREKGIQLEAYSPLTRGRKLDDVRLLRIAGAHGVTAAQVLIRWLMQHRVVAIPKSVKRDRIVENGSVADFELPRMTWPPWIQ